MENIIYFTLGFLVGFCMYLQVLKAHNELIKKRKAELAKDLKWLQEMLNKHKITVDDILEANENLIKQTK